MSTAIAWGDLPTWLSAVAALSALALAAVAVVVARRTLRIESRRDQLAIDASRQAQAILVSAWCDEQGLRVRNASQSPVYQRSPSRTIHAPSPERRVATAPPRLHIELAEPELKPMRTVGCRSRKSV